MDKSVNYEVLSTFVRGLSADERAFVRRRLLRRDSAALLRDDARLDQQSLAAVESRLWERMETASGPRWRRPRLRIWLIFMLLRYGGLRLVEIFALRPTDVDLREGLIYVNGAAQRTVPLPPAVAGRLRRVLEDPTLFCEKTTLVVCDAGYVRRCLLECSAECGLPTGLLNARALRANRALELGRQGLPLPVLEYFLGRSVGPRPGLMRCDAPAALDMLREHLQVERPVKTSARNVFQGRIVSLRSAGLLVEVVLAAVGGLRITAIITDESLRNLDLREGTPVNAGVKAPWVIVEPRPVRTVGGPEGADKIGEIGEIGEICSAPDAQSNAKPDAMSVAKPGACTAPTAENCFPAVVTRVREDDLVAEITATLSDGSPVCALVSKGAGVSLPQAGDKVLVHFKAFAVIISRD